MRDPIQAERNRASDADAVPESDTEMLTRRSWRNVISGWWRDPDTGSLWNVEAAAARARRIENEELAHIEE